MSWAATGFWILVGLNVAYGWVLWAILLQFRTETNLRYAEMARMLVAEPNAETQGTPGSTSTPDEIVQSPKHPLCAYCASPRLADVAEASINGQALSGIAVVTIGPLDSSRPVQDLVCLSCGKKTKIKAAPKT